MPNKYKEGTKMIPLRIDEELKDRAEQHCRDREIPLQEWIRRLMRRELGLPEEAEKPSKTEQGQEKRENKG